ncbi:MAG: hypothetical protein H6641_17595 [Caldilineaceae bacterium]|nr:hypothetical protein [Caldilineaceae bacterium]
MPQEITYSLINGFVHNWLVAGPLAQPVEQLARFSGEGAALKTNIAQHYYCAEPGIAGVPVELEKVNFAHNEREPQELTWRAFICDDDHFVDVSAFYHTCHHVTVWATAQVECAQAADVALQLTTNGPADVWLNGQHVGRCDQFHHQIPHTVSLAAHFDAGRNQLWVRFETVAIRENPNVMALQIADCPPDWRVVLATNIEPVQLRQQLETLFAQAYLDRDIFTSDEVVTIEWPVEVKQNICIRLQTPDGRIHSERHTNAKPLSSVRLGKAYQFPEGPYHIVLMADPESYYVRNMRVQRVLECRVVNNHFVTNQLATQPPDAHTPQAYATRRIEALRDAARRESGLFSQIAKMALGWWDLVKTEPILAQIESINARSDCSDFYMVGLLGMIYRFWEEPQFPDELRQPLQDCILNFKYWMDEPGNDAMCYWSENHQILFHTCEILAGQLFEDDLFSNVNQPGAWHREKGERMALSWLRKRAAGGFREWDSNTYFEEDVLALTHLVDLAESDEVAEMAAIVLDKLLLILAVNSYGGLFGSTHGRTYTPYIKSGYLEPTSGISRLLWGMGIYNERILGVVSIACAANYTFPLIIADIATDLPDEMWSREHHAGQLEPWCDLAEGQWAVNKVTYKTPDYMLCSVQDYLPGASGYQQHIWQATFGPDAVIFVNHPACVSEDGSHRPNAWHGNAILPRVAQWKDVLVAVHQLPAEDWLGFTHAYFPAYAFDESTLRDGWAFARVGEGYVALTATHGVQQATRGRNAYRELRSHGAQNVWLCMMGRAAQDGSFAQFQEKILALDVSLEASSVHADTLRGETIDFGWEGPLLVNEREMPIANFKHMENPYCTVALGSNQMEIRQGDQLMRLDFSA